MKGVLGRRNFASLVLHFFNHQAFGIAWLLGSAAVSAQPREVVPQDQALVDSASKLIESTHPTALELKEGLRQLQAAIKLNPQAARAHYELARYYAINGYVSEDTYRPGVLDQAIGAIKEATRVDPGYADGFIYEGYLQAHAGHFDSAREAFAAAHKLGSQSDWLALNEAEASVLSGAHAEAQQRLREFLGREHEFPRTMRDAHHLLVRSYSSSGLREQADRAYAAQVKAYPADPYVRSGYALLLATKFGDFDAAIARARESIGIDMTADGRRALGLALYAKWAVLRQTDPGAAKPLQLEAEAMLPMFMLAADPDLAEPKLEALKKEADQAGVLDEQGQPRFARYMLWRMLQIWGLAEVAWQVWLALAAVLLVFGIALDRAQLRRKAAAPRVMEAAPVEAPPVALQFTGSGGEYFRIWIVNLLLTILTLGIYSAWAKVRKLKYFYRNTELAGARFDYHGQPVAILKGRIIAVALLLAYKNAFVWSTSAGYATEQAGTGRAGAKRPRVCPTTCKQ